MSRRMVAPGMWLDEEPRVAVARPSGFLNAAPVGDMQPIVYAGGLTAMSPRPSDRPKPRVVVDRPVVQLGDDGRCGFLMRIANEPCGRLIAHKGWHATRSALDGCAARKRARFPRGTAA